MQSSAAKADVGVDLNDLRIRDRAPQAVLNSSYGKSYDTRPQDSRLDLVKDL